MIATQDLKIVMVFVLLAVTFIFAMLPLTLRVCFIRLHDPNHRRRMKSGISLLNCLTAGVFLGTCLLDLFPDVLDAMDTALDELNIKTKFPAAEFVVLFGFLILLILEQIVTRWRASHGHHDDHGLGHDHGHEHDHRQDHNHASARANDDHHVAFEASYGSIDSHNHLPVANEHTPLRSDHTHTHINSGEHNPLRDEEEGPTEENEEPAPDPSRHSIIRPLMLLTALSLHSVFEGLAISLQKTAGSVGQIVAALMLHKCIVAFSIGLNNVQSKFPVKLVVGLNLFFSLMSPIGIAIGIGIENMHDQLSTDVATAILQGIACGTFLYVIFMEILPHEFMSRRNHPDRVLKVFFLVLGLAAVVGIIFLDLALQ